MLRHLRLHCGLLFRGFDSLSANLSSWPASMALSLHFAFGLAFGNHSHSTRSRAMAAGQPYLTYTPFCPSGVMTYSRHLPQARMASLLCLCRTSFLVTSSAGLISGSYSELSVILLRFIVNTYGRPLHYRWSSQLFQGLLPMRESYFLLHIPIFNYQPSFVFTD